MFWLKLIFFYQRVLIKSKWVLRNTNTLYNRVIHVLIDRITRLDIEYLVVLLHLIYLAYIIRIISGFLWYVSLVDFVVAWQRLVEWTFLFFGITQKIIYIYGCIHISESIWLKNRRKKCMAWMSSSDTMSRSIRQGRIINGQTQTTKTL